jgi:hypothetical protein
MHDTEDGEIDNFLPSCGGARQGFCIVADGCVHLSDERGIANGGYSDFAALFCDARIGHSLLS